MEDPLSIVSRLIQVLVSINQNATREFDDLEEQGKFSPETVEKYLHIIAHIQKFAPLIEVTDHRVKILKKPFLETLSEKECLLLALFYNKVFHEDTANEIVRRDRGESGNIGNVTYVYGSRMNVIYGIKSLLNDDLIREKLPRSGMYYLTEDGKKMAFQLHQKRMDAIYQDYLKIAELVGSK